MVNFSLCFRGGNLVQDNRIVNIFQTYKLNKRRLNVVGLVCASRVAKLPNLLLIPFLPQPKPGLSKIRCLSFVNLRGHVYSLPTSNIATSLSHLETANRCHLSSPISHTYLQVNSFSM